MKKYLWLLVPMGGSLLLGAYLLLTPPSEFHTGGRTPNEALSVYWVLVGAVATLLLLICLLVHDLFAWLERRRYLRLAAGRRR